MNLGERIVDVAIAIVTEVVRAEKLHPPINSLHEGYAVIAEELDEFWEQVRLKARDRDPLAVRTELIQTAAVCVRTILNVCDRAE